MLNYEKTPQGNLQISVGGKDLRMFYRVMIGTGLLERRDMYEMKTFIEENFRQELGMANPVSTVSNDKGQNHGNEQTMQG